MWPHVMNHLNFLGDKIRVQTSFVKDNGFGQCGTSSERESQPIADAPKCYCHVNNNKIQG